MGIEQELPFPDMPEKRVISPSQEEDAVSEETSFVDPNQLSLEEEKNITIEGDSLGQKIDSLKKKFIDISEEKKINSQGKRIRFDENMSNEFMTYVESKGFNFSHWNNKNWGEVPAFVRKFDLDGKQKEVLDVLKSCFEAKKAGLVYSKVSELKKKVESLIPWSDYEIIENLLKGLSFARKRKFKNNSEKLGDFSNALCIFYSKNRKYFPKHLQEILDKFNGKTISSEADIPTPVIELKKVFKEQVSSAA